MICGLDEAGRGPLAGPVCAAAVVLPGDFPLSMLGDSKKLSPLRREEAAERIYASAFWGMGWASPEEIDEINILRASLLAMQRAFEDMLERFGKELPAAQLEAVADGLYPPEIPVRCSPMVKADAKVPAVMAASILAKTARDRVMERYSWIYPVYGYEKHKGYPTREHIEKIQCFGPSPIQRNSFKVKPHRES